MLKSSCSNYFEPFEWCLINTFSRPVRHRKMFASEELKVSWLVHRVFRSRFHTRCAPEERVPGWPVGGP